MSKCSTNGMGTFTPTRRKPWDVHRINHLYRRAGFGATPDKIKWALGKTPAEVVDDIMWNAKRKSIMPAPWYVGWSNRELIRMDGTVNMQGFNDIWIPAKTTTNNAIYENMREGTLHDRMYVFWMDHFASDCRYAFPSWMYKKIALYQEYALGNFKDFVRAVGLDPAMHNFLDGVKNKKGHPNENFARELFELFTLGVDNEYTEQDIRETARALTGYNQWERGGTDLGFNASGTDAIFTPESFDDGEKTIFGRTGNWGYDDVIDILFEEKGWHVAKFICTKLYQHFVSQDVKWNPLKRMIQKMRKNNYEIAPVLEYLLKSKHFFDDESIGTLIKSPADLIFQLQRELDFDVVSGNSAVDINTPTFQGTNDLGHNLISPPNVFGWPKHTNWLDLDALMQRWGTCSSNLAYQRLQPGDHFGDFARNIFGASETDAVKVAVGLIDRLLPNGFHYEDEYDEAIRVFKGSVPENLYEDGTWSLSSSTVGGQVLNLINHIYKSPEFQLR